MRLRFADMKMSSIGVTWCVDEIIATLLQANHIRHEADTKMSSIGVTRCVDEIIVTLLFQANHIRHEAALR